jgi:periplasmic protein TonB
MPRRTTPSVELRKRYPILMQVSMVISLALVIALFVAPIHSGDSALSLAPIEYEVVMLEDIEHTRQYEPPPPPQTPPPVVASDDIELEQIELDLDIDLDLGRAAVVPMAPPPPAPAAPPPVEEEPDIFVAVEQMPELIGGLASIQSRIRYPEMARRAGIEGVVIVQFVIDPEGRVTNPVVLRGIGGGADEAAIEAVRQARFTPGMQRGRPVRVQFAIPVRFSLNESGS